MGQSAYEGAARAYADGRMPYPAEMFAALHDALGLAGTERALDVGCGPGAVTLGLAPLVGSVVAIDADPGMIAEARRQAARAGAGGVTFRAMRAEELPGDLGRFDVVTCAQAFHWLDRRRVAGAVRELLTPDGAFVVIYAMTHQGEDGDDPLPHPRPPRAEITELVGPAPGGARRHAAATAAGGGARRGGDARRRLRPGRARRGRRRRGARP